MRSFHFSLQTQLTLFIAAFLAIVLGLALLAAFALRDMETRTEALASKWLDGTRILGEMADRVSEFRIAETYRALAHDEEARASADRLAATHRAVIKELRRDYEILSPPGAQTPDISRSRVAIDAYLAAHDARAARAEEAPAEEAPLEDSELHALYRAADDAVDAASEELRTFAHAEANAARRIAEGARAVMLLASLGAGALAAWLLLRVKRQIIQPLGDMTEALAQLAAGNRAIDAPEAGRDDEIGVMARSFDVFRANASALERAHEATRAAEAHAHALARQDMLTGLPNRRMLVAALHNAIDRIEDEGASFGLLIVDLDRFKPINDLEGYRIGDAVLVEAARRLRDIARKNDIVARLGGDEFAILMELPGADHIEQAERLASRALVALAEPIHVDDRGIELSASIGVALGPDDGLDVATLLRAADIAMNSAKTEGRGRFRFFERSMDEELRARVTLESALKKAIADGDIRPFYQPLVDLRDNRIYGFEMLSRWTHAERGNIPPDVFIPLAEQTGVIAELTWSVLRRACEDARHWGEGVGIALNVSPMQLKDPFLAAQLLATLAEQAFPPRRLEVEITESALVDDVETARATLAALQAEGVKISLDDFGAGYSSLYHLRAFHFDKVKIDRSFVLAMQRDEESGKIVDAILSLLKHLGLPTVAEGIETATVLRRLAERGCEFGQGFYFGEAMSVADATALLRRGLDLHVA